jgi:hypothetical protein
MMWDRVKKWVGWYARSVEWMLTLFPGKWLAGVAILALVILAVVLPFIETKSDSLGWYGVALGVFGFWYTASQLYLTKRESEAAKNAADAANLKAEETIRQFREEADRTLRLLSERAAADAYRRLIHGALYFLDDALTLAAVRQWKIVGSRLRDAARQLQEVQAARKHADERWVEFANVLNQLAERLGREAQDTKKLPQTFPDSTWAQLTGGVRTALVQERSGIQAEEIE